MPLLMEMPRQHITDLAAAAGNHNTQFLISR